MNLASSSHGGKGKQARQEVSECPDSDDYDEDEDKKSSSETNEQKEEDKIAMAPPARNTPATLSLPPTIVKEMDEMFLRLGFSQAVALNLVNDQGINSQ